MSKYTKKQYLADIAANAAAIEANKAELAGYNDRIACGEEITPELSDDWNAAHDRGHDLGAERADIERRWSMRNWTGQDYAEYELVSQNID